VSSIFKKISPETFWPQFVFKHRNYQQLSLLQLSQVQLAVAASSPGPDRDSLVCLQSNIEELITLTRENLTGLQSQENERDVLQTGAAAADQYDKEYALLKVSCKCKIMRCHIKPNKCTWAYGSVLYDCVPCTCFSYSCGSLRDAHYKEYVHHSITDVFEPMHTYFLVRTVCSKITTVKGRWVCGSWQSVLSAYHCM
jgi:hypothetical protein